MSQVFISYAKEDTLRAEMLSKALQDAGFSVWWDRHIPPGKTWDQVIGCALDAATCALVLWSKASVESRWVREEANRASRRECLIPVLIEKVDPPIGFGLLQAADLTEWRGDRAYPEFVNLCAAVSDLFKNPPSIGVYSSLNATTERIRFFEGGPDAASQPQPQYTSEFHQGSIRFVYCRLSLHYRAPKQPKVFDIEASWFDPHGNLEFRQTLNARIEPGWTDSTCSWGNPSGPNLAPGAHMVILAVQGVGVARGSFWVLEPQSA